MTEVGWVWVLPFFREDVAFSHLQVSVQVSPFHKDTNHVGLGPVTSSQLVTSVMAIFPDKVTFCGLQHMNLWGTD